MKMALEALKRVSKLEKGGDSLRKKNKKLFEV